MNKQHDNNHEAKAEPKDQAQPAVKSKAKAKSKSGLSIVALLIGLAALIVAGVLPFAPKGQLVTYLFCSLYICGALAVAFGIVACIAERKRAISISGIILGIIALILATLINTRTLKIAQFQFSPNNSEQPSKSAASKGQSAEYASINDAIKKEIDIKLGKFIDKGAKPEESGLPITVKNITSSTASYHILVAATDAKGRHVAEDAIDISNLPSQQSQTIYAFKFAAQSKMPEVKNATFQLMAVGRNEGALKAVYGTKIQSTAKDTPQQNDQDSKVKPAKPRIKLPSTKRTR